jgi:penicillin-binding protein 2
MPAARKLPLFHKGDIGNMDFNSRSRDYTGGIVYLMIALVGVFFLMMILRLFELTIVKGNYYRSLSENNRIREVTIEAERGKIVDRKGYVLADSSNVEVTESLKRIESKRLYKEPEQFSHVIGYRQIADKTDIANDPCLNKLKLGDKTGKKGVERLYECELRGRNGKKLIEVNAQGLFKRTLNVIEPEHGRTIQLALDSDLQKRAYQMLDGKKGVVVAMDPRSGEILAMASTPSFNPQAFEDNDAKEVSRLFNDENKPLFNRATEGTYPPGSVFKMVVAAAALEEEAIDRDTVVADTGKITAGNREFGTWNYLEHGQTEGDVDVIKSLQRSNDIFYYKIGEKIGPEKIKSWAEVFGYQARTGIGIDEAMGTIPSPFWKQDTIKEQWYTGDTFNLSIGQGFVLTTPLQVTIATAPFANEDGEACTPTLVKLGTPYAPSKRCKKIPMTEAVRATIREGMHQACKVGGTGWPLFNFRVKDPNAPTPTPSIDRSASESALLAASGSAVLAATTSARIVSPSPTPTVMPIERLWDPSYLLASGSAALGTKPMEVGCKTGTAESFQGEEPHAWFTAFAPFDNPEILVTVLLEKDGQGSDRAAPVAREILRTYFETGE